jgi:DNA-binding transcriptional LysR family regulator
MADLNSLAIFARVVEARSFSEAARRLKMPISTVSRRVAELEDQLGVRLLERSTRNLRLSDIGAEILAHAERAVELSEALDLAVSNQLSTVAGRLRLSVPPSVSDTLLAPLLSAFLASYPHVRVEVLVTERHVEHIAEGIDLAFRIGTLRDSSLAARRILTYRRQLVAAPAYLQQNEPPAKPSDLLEHRLLAFSRRSGDASWTFVHRCGRETRTVSFVPFLTMNDYAGLTPSLLTGAGIGELPPVVQPELLRTGRLVEVMPDWRFPSWDLSVVHLGNRHIPRPVRVFKEFAAQMAPTLFPDLPT